MTTTVLDRGQYFGELLRQEQHAWGACSLGVYAPDEAIGAHYHVNNYISLLVQGAYAEKGREVDRPIAVGQTIYRPASYTHANHFRDAGGVCFNIEFNAPTGGEFAGRLPAKVHAYPTGAFRAIYKLFYAFRQQEDCTEHFIHLYDELTETPVCRGRLGWVDKVKAILENEIDDTHTIGQLAGRVFVHPVYLARAFRERTGLTVGEYQSQCKLRKAARLLAETSLSGVEIAYRAGFYDPAHFSRTFKIRYGFTPGQFRALYKS